MTRQRNSRRDERGVSLVLVLVTLVVFGLLVPVLGQFGSTNGVSGYILKGQRFDRYAAEAGMQGAIQWAQAQRQAGRQGVHCPTITTDDQNGGTPNSDRSVTVTCAGFDNTGRPQATPSMPQYALQALGGGAAIKINGGGKMRTDGAWWSNGSITGGSNNVDASADYVGASGSCPGIAASPADCGTGTRKDDPAWSVQHDSPLTVDPIRGNCDDVSPAGVATIAPGLHWDRAYFQRIGSGGCNVSTIYLEPGGPHLFDFSFYGGSGSDWTIAPGNRRVTVRAGTSTAGTDTCADSGNVEPVQFAQDFTLDAKGGATLRLCGGLASGQQVAVTQVTAGDNPQLQSPPSPAATTVGVVDHGDPFNFGQGPIPVGALAAVDCVPRPRATCQPNVGFISGSFQGPNGTGEVAVGVPDQVPAGAWLKSITIELTHEEIQGFRNDLRQLRIWITGLPPGYAAVCNLSRNGNGVDASNDWVTATNNITCDSSQAHQPYFSTGNLAVHVAIDTNGTHREGLQTVNPDVTLDLDHVAISSMFVAPGYRDSNGFQNPLLRVDGASVRSEGTVYLPTGQFNANFGGATGSFFARGVTADAVTISGLPNDPTFAPFQLVGGGAYTDRLTTFVATVAGSATPALVAKVRFCDPQPEGGAHNDAADQPDGCAGPTSTPARILAWYPRR